MLLKLLNYKIIGQDCTQFMQDGILEKTFDKLVIT